MTQISINSEILKGRMTPLSSFFSFSLGKYNNWIIPDYVACGPFPGLDGVNYTSDDEVRENLQTLRDAGIDTFVSLQAEVSPKGELNERFLWAFPQFKNYTEYLKDDKKVKYIHIPFEDMSIPDMDRFMININTLLETLMRGKKLFIHCAGGHGRTGIFATILILLLENCTIKESIKNTQKRHDQRLNKDKRQSNSGIVLSPSTKIQRNFVFDAGQFIYPPKVESSKPFGNYFERRSNDNWFYTIDHGFNCSCCACKSGNVMDRDCGCSKCSDMNSRMRNKIIHAGMFT